MKYLLFSIVLIFGFSTYSQNSFEAIYSVEKKFKKIENIKLNNEKSAKVKDSVESNGLISEIFNRVFSQAIDQKCKLTVNKNYKIFITDIKNNSPSIQIEKPKTYRVYDLESDYLYYLNKDSSSNNIQKSLSIKLGKS